MKVIDILNLYNFRDINDDEDYRTTFSNDGFDTDIVRLCDVNDIHHYKWFEFGIWNFSEETRFSDYINEKILNAKVEDLRVISNTLFIYYDGGEDNE